MADRDLDRYREEYLARYGFEREQVKYRRRRILEILERYRPARILEAGCGLESLAGFHTGFREFTIVEPVKEFFEQVREQAGSGVLCVNGRFEDALPVLREREFDFILLSSLLHEVSDPGAVLETARRLAGAGTVVHVNTPNARSIHRLLGVKMGLSAHVREPSELAGALQRHGEYDLADLARLARDHGFTVVEQGSYFLKPLSHGQMGRLLDSGRIGREFLDGLYEVGPLLPENGSEIFVNLRVAGA